ncbi:SAM-dependent methyltransferase [Salinifilum aidingensis]
MASGVPSDEIDTSVPHSARVWNYWLGGKDNYEVDRELGDVIHRDYPSISAMARGGRDFLVRVVEHLAGLGVRQFLDIGTGLPTADNTHEVAHRSASGCRVVYVDNDPLVLAHARALLRSVPGQETRYVHADLHDAEQVLDRAGEALDLNRPVAVLLMGVLGHIADTGQAKQVVDGLLTRLPPGSYLALYDGSNLDEGVVEAERRYNETAPLPYHLRSPEEIERLFEGLEYVPPGLVRCAEWCGTAEQDPAAIMGAVARKPR